ncbi:MAG TPA: helix-turn-helix domain-containing protein [Nitriliruptorales bacterium]
MSDSGLVAAVERVGDRWTLLLVEALLDGPSRYGELQERVASISPSILSARLKALEAAGLVLASPYQDRPTRFAYELTATGQELAGALRLLADWGSRQGEGEPDEGVRHETCGTPAEARWYCPTCEVLIDDEDAALHHL